MAKGIGCLLLAALATVSSCSGDSTPVTAPSPDPLPAVQVKDIVIDHLPSPFYHFDYDASGRVRTASYASGLRTYDLAYAAGRLSEMNGILGNHDRLIYSYDDAGRVSDVRYEDAMGKTFTRVHFTYDGQTLIGVERQRLLASGFVTDKTMAMSYGLDGNLLDLTEHHPAIPGVQDEVTFADHYERYDSGINVDSFGLLHSEFFDHLILLPQVRLQKNNPGAVTRSGDGINFRIEYTYTYDEGNRPLTQTGDGTMLNGSNAGERFPTRTTYSYY